MEQVVRMEVNDLSFSYSGREVLEHVNLRVRKGAFTGMIGPNGSGKTTLIKNLYRALRPDSGEVRLDSSPLLEIPRKLAAQKLGVVGQEQESAFDFTVEDLVGMGRTPHKKLFEPDNTKDRRMVYHALEHLGLEEMPHRSYRSLSGGEKQRVMLARVIAQETDFFLLDEPTNHLDIRCQLELFDFVKRLNVTVLAAMHDLNMAALYCDYLYVLKDGAVSREGTPGEILTAETIKEVYGADCLVSEHPVTGRPVITYLPAHLSNRRETQ